PTRGPPASSSCASSVASRSRKSRGCWRWPTAPSNATGPSPAPGCCASWGAASSCERVAMSADPRLPELFAQGAELPPAQRGAWLAALHTNEPALAAEVAALLAAADRDGGLLDAAPPAAALGDALADGDTPPPRVGPYRILRELGRGGMGRVFL